jgi:hypothetical protein
LTDLARSYVLIAKSDAAARTCLTACGLAPTNRFVLRSAARLFLHLKDESRALKLLRASPRLTMSDPWLIAAEVSISSASRSPSAFAKSGLRAAADEKFSPFSRTELNSALATLEMENGKANKARKLFGESLIAPNENALAQAEFAGRQLGGIRVEPQQLRIARSYEANAYFSFNRAAWERAVQFGQSWLDDQPFSTRPAIFMSFVSSCFLEDYASSVKVLQRALEANPGRPQLLNNLAFSLASMGRTADAERELRKVNLGAVDGLYRITLTATGGLIQMRRGEVELGRQLYLESMELARKQGNPTYEAMAAAYFAGEELIAGVPNAEGTLRLAKDKAGTNPPPDLVRLLDIISHDFEQRSSQKKLG